MAWVLLQEGPAGIHAAQVQGAAQVRPVHPGVLWRCGRCGPGEPVLEAELAQQCHDAKKILQRSYSALDRTTCDRTDSKSLALAGSGECSVSCSEGR